MKPVVIHDKNKIEQFFRRNLLLHIYEIGDLDEFFWRYTSWYALQEQQEITQLALLYIGISPPTLLALTEEPEQMGELLRALGPILPKSFYAHLSDGLADVFAETYQLQPHGMHYKMALTDHSRLGGIDTSQVVPLTSSHQTELEAFYRASYPGNWFDSRMLETGFYYGLRRGADLVSVAGVHVYSPQYKVAALGNITTHPDFRGQGLATAVSAKLCQALLSQVEHIGLNVKADNAGAIACYQRLGFERIAVYGEYSLALKSSG
jgi:ribosomal protein S18 acetylase RimI-like enzyme